MPDKRKRSDADEEGDLRHNQKQSRSDEGERYESSKAARVENASESSRQPTGQQDASESKRRQRSTSPASSPSRKRKRPGGASRISTVEREAARQKRMQRERHVDQLNKAEVVSRGIQDVVKEHYNAVPERGREWRVTESRIRGLRAFNNWVKSALIQMHSPGDEFRIAQSKASAGPHAGNGFVQDSGLVVLDIGCGKGGDLQKWQQAPQKVNYYVGLDPAEVSIRQARDRFEQMRSRGRNAPRGRRPQLYRAEFHVKDCFGEFLGDVPAVRQVGIDPNIGPGGNPAAQRWGGGGFDVVSMMFCMHYAFESETKARMMLKNVAGSLKKGGRFLGVIPNSDIISAKVEEFHKRQSTTQSAGQDTDDDDGWDPEKPAEEPQKQSIPSDDKAGADEPALEWGNSIYKVRFPGITPKDGVFRPPFGWKYSYFLEEAVSEVPEYVVPWEAFRALAEDYSLELQYRKPFKEVWKELQSHQVLGPLSERMGVRDRANGRLLVNDEELEGSGFYHAFCFYKV